MSTKGAAIVRVRQREAKIDGDRLEIKETLQCGHEQYHVEYLAEKRACHKCGEEHREATYNHILDCVEKGVSYR